MTFFPRLMTRAELQKEQQQGDHTMASGQITQKFTIDKELLRLLFTGREITFSHPNGNYSFQIAPNISDVDLMNLLTRALHERTRPTADKTCPNIRELK